MNADYEADEYGYSVAVQVENWRQVKERLVVDMFQCYHLFVTNEDETKNACCCLGLEGWVLLFK